MTDAIPERLLDREEQTEDYFETIRPRTLAEYIGQETIKDNLTIFIDAAKNAKNVRTYYFLRSSWFG